MDTRAGQVERDEPLLDERDVPAESTGVVATTTSAGDGSGGDAIEATRAEIEHTRAEMSETIGALKEKLSPERLVEQAKETVREATVGRAQEAVSNVIDTTRDVVSGAVDTAREAAGHAGETAREAGSTVLETIQRNPAPAALAAVGLGWLYVNWRRGGEAAGYRGDPSARAGFTGSYAPIYGASSASGQPAGPYTFHPAPGYQPAAASTPAAGTAAAGGAPVGVRIDHTTAPVPQRPADQRSPAIVAVIQENPLPIALAAIGIGWLVTSGRRRPVDQWPSGGRDARAEAEARGGAPYSANKYPASDRGRAEGGVADAAREKLGEAVDTAREKVGAAVESAREGMGEMVDTARERVSGTVEATRETMQHAAQRAREGAGQVGESARDLGSSLAGIIQRHPVPAAMTAVGIGWLLAASRQDEARHYPSDAGYSLPDGPGRGRSATGHGLAAVPERVGEVVDQVRDRAVEFAGQVQQQAGDLSNRAQQQAQRAQGEFERVLQQNPLAVAAAAMALGAAVGLAVPETPAERRLMGEARDRLVETMQQSGQELAQKAQQVTQQTIETARQEIEEQSLIPKAPDVAGQPLESDPEEVENEPLVPTAGGDGGGSVWNG